MAQHIQASKSCRRLFRVSLVGLPFLYYPSLLGLLIVLGMLLVRFRKTALDSLTRTGLMVITGLMILSCIFAFNKGEAFLQLANFLPFFLLFAVMPFLLKTAGWLEQLAADLVIASIPINAIACFEYLLKSSWVPRSLQDLPFITWVRDAPHVGRAMAMFDHPNTLASYLVLIMGLGLGLILKHSAQKRTEQPSPTHLGFQPRFPALWIYIATYLNLIGIFGSGSRNGVVVAVSQLVLFSLLNKTSRTVLLTGAASLLAILAGSMVIGIGGRAVSLGSLAADPRVTVWQIALDLMQERPWLGWGLGNYKFLYPPRSIDPDYPQVFHPHNFWLLLGSEAGILLMLLLTIGVGYICFKGARLLVSNQLSPTDSALLQGYLLAFWGCVAFALFDVTFYDARINIINWFLLAGIYTITKFYPSQIPSQISSQTDKSA